MTTDFQKRIEVALSDDELRNNFRGAMDFLQQKRRRTFADNAEWQRLQDYGASLRAYVIDHLPDLLEQLEDNCHKNGMQVHWAENAEAANKQILAIARSHGAKRVIKGKSMASEEIEMNTFLEEHGIECTESDMGEYIVQLAGEKPSHIIMPAIHKNKKQIADVFDRKLREKRDPNDVDGLIGVGRTVLREKFKHADIGVSGVNFAIADRGTLCLIENEGNGRLSTTAPRVHIALMGLEKVIPNMAALPALQRLLTRSATGQHVTTYLNMISGPRKHGEKDGPEEIHLILLDNGRTSIARDPDLNTTLACIRCGACMNHCPVYTRIGGHAYGSTYPGPIGQVVTPQLQGMKADPALVDACSLNGACGEACPVGIRLPDLIRTLRSRKKTPPVERSAWSIWQLVHSKSALYRIATRLLRILPGVLSWCFPSWQINRTSPKPAKKTLHERVRERGTQHD